MKILIIDDSKAARRVTRNRMEAAGFGDHEFVEAGDGMEGIEAIKREKPELVMCDWNMPGLTGIELLERINTLGIRPRFGFVTSEKESVYREAAEEKGADFLLHKPFGVGELIATIGPILAELGAELGSDSDEALTEAS